MGHNRAEVWRLSVLAAGEAGARACNPGPVPARVSLGRCPCACREARRSWLRSWARPGSSAWPTGVLLGRFGPSQSLCRMCY